MLTTPTKRALATALGFVGFLVLTAAATGISTQQARTAAPSTLDGTQASSSEGSSISFMRSDAKPATLYTAPGTGAVAQTFAQTFGRTASVKEYGAVCDGTTDDTVAVNRAIAAGVPVVTPSTACKTTGPLGVIPAGSQIVNGIRVEPDMQQGAQTATQIVTSKLIKGAEDAFITVISDSTAFTYNYNTTPTVVRWVTRFATELGARYPAYTVKFNEWDDTTLAYLGWVTLQTGTGAQTLWVYNASWPGMGTSYVLGANLSPMVLATTPDLIIISHGHNEGTASNYSADMLALTEELSSALPAASVLIIGQNPQTAPAVAPASQPIRVSRYAEIAGRRGYGFLNMYQTFLDYGPTWATDLIQSTDGIHPNDAGSQLWADEVTKAFAYRGRYAQMPSKQRSTLSIESPAQLLLNGNFSEWDNGVPAHWGGTAAHISQDTTNFESTNGYSVKVTTSAAADSIGQNLPLQLVKGRCVTLSARVYVASGQPINAGRLFISDNLGNTQSSQIPVPYGQGGMRWKVVQRCFDPAITTASVRLYGDASSTSGAASFDRVSAVLDVLPYDVAMNRDATRFYRVNADFTTAANTSLQAIPGLLWTIPTVATALASEAFPFECHLLYSQATANAAVAFGVKATATMANFNAQAQIQTAAAAFTAGALTGLTSITATPVVSATPSAVATVFVADLHGVQELVSAGTNSEQIMVSTATAADAVTIKRGSYCLVKFN